MTKLVLTTVYLTCEQRAKLRRLKRQGKGTMSRTIRQALDRHLAEGRRKGGRT